MSKIESIEQQIEKLSPEELATFRRWYAAFDAEVWDRQFEADVKAGKLDACSHCRPVDETLTHHAAQEFWASYNALPASIREQADSAFELLKANPQHPSLHFKKVGRFWSARVGLHYRAVGVDARDGIVWFWIGTHAEYDKLIT
jgi:hypothetical protein